MSSRFPLLLPVAAALALAVSACAAPARPNMLFILTDDQTYRAIGYNNPFVRTPALDALANGGVIFEHAYVATPICAASRASILIGLFPQQHGTIGLNSAAFTQRVVRERSLATLPQLLAAAGYRTALFGKSHLGDPKRYGFDEGGEQKEDAEAREPRWRSRGGSDSTAIARAARAVDGRGGRHARAATLIGSSNAFRTALSALPVGTRLWTKA